MSSLYALAYSVAVYPGFMTQKSVAARTLGFWNRLDIPLMPPIAKIVSGGQTGADRMGLDWAIWHDIPHGGWCPKFRKAEDGKIPLQYQLTETPRSDYVQRTEWNVRDSDGTLIFSLNEKLSRGSAKTAFFCQKHGKPFLHVHPGLSYSLAADVLRFVSENGIKVLNIAGTRASKEPYVGKFVKHVLEDAFFPKSQGLIGGPDEG